MLGDLFCGLLQFVKIGFSRLKWGALKICRIVVTTLVVPCAIKATKVAATRCFVLKFRNDNLQDLSAPLR